jgi:hypothetical protein
MTFPAPVIQEVPPDRPPAAGEPAVHAWRVEWPQPPAPPPVAEWGSPVPLATLAEDPDPPAEPPAPAAVLVTELVAEAPPPTEPVPPHLWPLIGLNAVFNVLTHLLGPTGAWLRGPGRTLLGWLGVGMLLAAGTWAAGEWLGYDWPTVDLSRLGLTELRLQP